MNDTEIAESVAAVTKLAAIGDWQAAIPTMRRILATGYKPAESRHALGVAMMAVGEPDEAVSLYREALAINPDLSNTQENLIFLLDAQPGTTGAHALAERNVWWERFGKAAYDQRLPHTNNRDPERPLLIGYVSCDFRFHSAAIAYSGVITRHSDRYKAVCYSTLPPSLYDPTTESLKGRIGGAFYDVSCFTQQELAQIVRAHEIDILVDLSGYTAGNRLITFAHKPAPIQITAWGYATGVGWPAMDVLFGDRVATAHYQGCERAYELPSVITYEPRPGLPEAGPLPSLTGSPVFSVFQRGLKINAETCRVWTEILKRVPEAVLLFKGPDYTPPMKEYLFSHMADVREQIQFASHTTHHDHLLWYQIVDLSLDPWPQTGGVSTLEALWMGVPCVTLLGDRVIQRASASFLANLGLDEFVALTEADYIRTAVEFVTTRRDELAGIRAGLRERLAASPIMTGYVDAVETAYRSLWREWCATQPD